MGWGLGTWFSVGIHDDTPDAPVLIESHDFPFYVRGWDENWDTPLGRPLAPLLTPYPATRSTLDDDTGYGGWSEQPNGPALAGGRRAQEIWRARKYAALFAGHISVKQPTPGISPPIAAVGDQSYVPVQMRYLDRSLRYKLATTEEGLHRIHPSDMITAQYNDDACRIMSEVQRHFLEPVIDGGVTWQHGLWTPEEVSQALYQRLQRFVYEAELTRKEATSTGTTGRIDKPQDLLVLKRVEWEYTDHRKRPRGLTRIDYKQADQAYPGWEDTHAEPNSFAEKPSSRNPDLFLVPPPNDQGVTWMRYVPQHNFEGDCPNLGIPRMFTWAIKWGVIADLLHKEGEANDPVRAAAAEELFTLGVKLARLLIGEEQ